MKISQKHMDSFHQTINQQEEKDAARLQNCSEWMLSELSDRIIFPMTSYSLDSFFCRICYNLVQKPKLCSSCGKVFCKHCLEKWLKLKKMCPYKCSSKEFKNLNGFYLSTYKKLGLNENMKHLGVIKDSNKINSRNINLIVNFCLKKEQK